MPISSTDEARHMAERRHSLDTYVKSIVDRAPELTPEQRDRLAGLLRGNDGRTPDSGEAA